MLYVEICVLGVLTCSILGNNQIFALSSGQHSFIRRFEGRTVFSPRLTDFRSDLYIYIHPSVWPGVCDIGFGFAEFFRHPHVIFGYSQTFQKEWLLILQSPLVLRENTK